MSHSDRLKTRPKTRLGFTLVELLVVIGVIAVLLGILLPVMGKVRIAARRTACAAQLKDIGNQFHMYLDANKDRLPRVNPDGRTYDPNHPDTGMVPGALPLAILLKPYNGGAYKVFRCPADFLINNKLEGDYRIIDENGDGVPDSGLPMLSNNAESWYEAVGSSYEYSGRFNATADLTIGSADPDEQKRHLMETFTAKLGETNMRDGAKRPPSQIWIFRDCDPFHGKVIAIAADGTKTFSPDARNFLYADFHVGTTPYGNY